MQIFFDKTCVLDVLPDDTIEVVKQKIQVSLSCVLLFLESNQKTFVPIEETTLRATSILSSFLTVCTAA